MINKIFSDSIFKSDRFHARATQEGVDCWMRVPFKCVEEIFPEWAGARKIVTEFCDACVGIDIGVDRRDPRSIYASFLWQAGYSLPVELVPQDDGDLLCSIAERVLAQRTPNLRNYYLTQMRVDTFYAIRNEFLQFDNQIISLGGRSLLEDLRFKLGISPIGAPLHSIHVKVSL